ncbi:MAG: UDP-N-acetylmuramoylalanyl-D-glutamyl-2,6-diaminopimelate--D-alanyl-D-alanine ligase [Hyphomicrobiales bacterium]|nr:UDP-N-acetylmuramoylalanyl-D-glutamyl-2,6-diaminopimelate--D-alanyl-D-alanine ligase [Hyphomicrobiales bacterium]MDE2116065.1 UDP-N-acetylmuramoylalanyl-D-glutamyl-2,6-diaminopimelate--D-alanyl-D-alanine ligase [Hyphomicrobiales bacterium]
MTGQPAIKHGLWTGLGLVGPLQARVSGNMPDSIGDISIDTRTLKPGDLFFAILGENTDGHDYVAKALAAGAGAAVIDEAHADALTGTGPLYVVREVLPALERLGQAARARSTARIAAVTGSVGKTSTKDALALTLATQGATHASKASYNNHWGVPLTLAKMPESARYGVFEIGMNHAGEITPLVAMVKPHVAIVTTVAPVHLEYFGSVDAIARAKGEIFSGLVKGGAAIINRDVPQFAILQEMAKASPAGHIISFGRDSSADAHLLSVEIFPEGTYVEASVLGKSIKYRLGAPGQHFAENSLAILLAARLMGLELELAAKALEGFHAPKGRGSQTRLPIGEGHMTLLDESYNANPASMRSALAVLGALPPGEGGRRVAILGDMLELGDEAGPLHAELARTIEIEKIDQVLCAGPNMKFLFEALPKSRRAGWFENAEALAPRVAEALQVGDVVMIKGSNSSRMGLIVQSLMHQFANSAGTGAA